MEKENGKYNKLIRLLRDQEPVLENPEAIADRVMDEIRSGKESKSSPGILMTLFGWAYIGWSRNTLTLGATLLIVFFVFQHITLFSKVRQLENRLIRTSYDYYQSPYQSQENLIRFMAPGNVLISDSVKISKQDLINFLQSYHDMEVNYDKLKQYLQEEMNKQKRRADKNGKKISKNQSI